MTYECLIIFFSSYFHVNILLIYHVCLYRIIPKDNALIVGNADAVLPDGIGPAAGHHPQPLHALIRNL